MQLEGRRTQITGSLCFRRRLRLATGQGLEVGVTRMLERMEAGTLKLFSHLHDWFEEFAIYHRTDGVVVKEHDDLLSATRYGLMELRSARKKPTRATRRERAGTSAWAM